MQIDSIIITLYRISVNSSPWWLHFICLELEPFCVPPPPPKWRQAHPTTCSFVLDCSLVANLQSKEPRECLLQLGKVMHEVHLKLICLSTGESVVSHFFGLFWNFNLIWKIPTVWNGLYPNKSIKSPMWIYCHTYFQVSLRFGGPKYCSYCILYWTQVCGSPGK